jgi:SNF2 family DNA or RNA helicase
LKNVNREWVLNVKGRFGDRILRRDLRSLRWDGETVNKSLPPKKIIVATCRLSEKELAVLDGEIDDMDKR